MAEIVTSPIETATSSIHNAFLPLKFLWQHLASILMVILVATALGVGLYFYWKKQDLQHQQEDTLYKEYKNTISSCEINRDKRRYSKKYSKLNIIFCLGLPFIKKEIGRKFYNERQEFIGFYDGHFEDSLGNHNFLLWKKKTFFMKNYFVLRIPTNIITMDEKDKKIKFTKKPIPKGKTLVKTNNDLTTTIKMLNMEKQGFYFYPIISDDTDQKLDFTSTINAMNYMNHNRLLLENVIKESGKNVSGMAKINTQLVYEQRVPEKVKEVERENEY